MNLFKLLFWEFAVKSVTSIVLYFAVIILMLFLVREARSLIW